MMKQKLWATCFLVGTVFATAFSESSDWVGAWKGPKDLMVNICATGEGQVSVCYCSIFRTFGWTIVASSIEGDSLLIKARDIDSPLEGRFRMESADRLTGTLIMGGPDDDWYFNGRAEFFKQKPLIPTNLNPSLEGIVRTSDYENLSLARDKIQRVLAAVSPNLYGYAEKRIVEKLLNAKTESVTPEDMLGFRRVRSIQIDALSGIFSYPYFNCRFRKTTDGHFFFDKTTGSQRKSGYVYQNSPESLVFLGGWRVNEEPRTIYGSANSVAGILYKIGPCRAILLFPLSEDRVEIYELIK